MKGIPRNLEQRAILEQPTSPFLRLPGEIRNEIYAYVFQADGDLEFIHRSAYTHMGYPSVAKKSYLTVRGIRTPVKKEFNQLKYVCRQLYTETACLEFVSNTIFFDSVIFEGGGVVGAGQLFSLFIRECAPSKAAWLSRIDLSYHTSEDFFLQGFPSLSVTFGGVGDFCHAYPKCTVRFFLFDLKTQFRTMSEFLFQGFVTNWVVRGKAFDDFHDNVHFDWTHSLRFATAVVRTLGLEFPNFRVFPRVGACIDKEILKDLGKLPNISDESYIRCVDLAKDWVQNGI